jgi:hypothetical protein
MILYPLDANEIFPLLFQGSVPPQGPILREMGFSAVVLCADESQPPAWKFEGIDVIHAPNDDNPVRPPTREELDIAVKAAKQVVKRVLAGKKVLVTCMAGLNRSGLVNALALHMLTGWAGTMCVDHVQAKREAALCNRYFVEVICKIPARVPNPQEKTVLQASRRFTLR